MEFQPQLESSLHKKNCLRLVDTNWSRNKFPQSVYKQSVIETVLKKIERNHKLSNKLICVTELTR